MNRGFAFYFKNAIKSSFATVWKNRNILQVTAYFLAELVARLTIVFSALFDLADVRQGKSADESGRLDVPQVLSVSTKSKPVWTMVVSIIAEAFIFLGGALIIAAITAVFALIGYAIVAACAGPLYIIAIVCAPGGLLLLAYTALFIIIFSPTPYIIETNPEIGVAETVKICLETMKNRGKTTAFLNFFVPTLIELFILGICAVGAWLISAFVGGITGIILLCVWLIISLALCVLTLPTVDLIKKVAQKSLFEDIVLDPVNLGKRTAGINIKMCEGVKFEPSAVKGNLVALFDETQPDSVPAPDSPARKKVKEKAEKAAEKRKEKNKEEEQESGQKEASEQAETPEADEKANVTEVPQPAAQAYEEPRQNFTQPYTEPQQNFGQQYAESQQNFGQQYAEPQQNFGQQYAEPQQNFSQPYNEPQQNFSQPYNEPQQNFSQPYAAPQPDYTQPAQDFNIIQGDDGFNDADYGDGFGAEQYGGEQYTDPAQNYSQPQDFGYNYEQPAQPTPPLEPVPPAEPPAEEKPRKRRGLGKK